MSEALEMDLYFKKEYLQNTGRLAKLLRLVLIILF